MPCWSFESSVAYYNEGLTLTTSGSQKRSITEEARVLASDLLKYHEIKWRFKEYKLEWMSEEPGIYYPAMVRELYAYCKIRGPSQ